MSRTSDEVIVAVPDRPIEPDFITSWGFKPPAQRKARLAGHLHGARIGSGYRYTPDSVAAFLNAQAARRGGNVRFVVVSER